MISQVLKDTVIKIGMAIKSYQKEIVKQNASGRQIKMKISALHKSQVVAELLASDTNPNQ